MNWKDRLIGVRTVIQLICQTWGTSLSAFKVKVLRRGAEAVRRINSRKVLCTPCLGSRQERAAEQGKTGRKLDVLMGHGAFWTKKAWRCDVEGLNARGENRGSIDIVVEASSQAAADAYFASVVDGERGVHF